MPKPSFNGGNLGLSQIVKELLEGSNLVLALTAWDIEGACVPQTKRVLTYFLN